MSAISGSHPFLQLSVLALSRSLSLSLCYAAGQIFAKELNTWRVPPERSKHEQQMLVLYLSGCGSWRQLMVAANNIKPLRICSSFLDAALMLSHARLKFNVQTWGVRL